MQKQQRILAYSMSRKLSSEDLQNISAAGSTMLATDTLTYMPNGGTDTGFDVSSDI